MTQNLMVCASFDVRKYIKQILYHPVSKYELKQKYAWELIGEGRMKIEMPVQVNIPVEEVIEYLKKDGTLVDVVRCKDCRNNLNEKLVFYLEDNNTPVGFCEYLKRLTNPDDFCSYGERR